MTASKLLHSKQELKQLPNNDHSIAANKINDQVNANVQSQNKYRFIWR